MAAALGTWSALTASKPKRIEGHTSNVEHPILYVQYIKGTVGETTEAGDTYIIPHKFTNVHFINASPLAGIAAVETLYGDISDATDGAYFADAAIATGPTQCTTAATAGSTSLVLTSGSAINDVYNNCWLELKFSSGNTQVVKITDYVGATTTATLADGLAEAVGTTGTYYTVRGTIMTVASSAATPTINFEVVGSFE
jgi:hypothetical protein